MSEDTKPRGPGAPSEEALELAHAFMRESFGCQEVFCTFARGCGCAERLAEYAARAVAAERERCLRIMREEVSAAKRAAIRRGER